MQHVTVCNTVMYRNFVSSLRLSEKQASSPRDIYLGNFYLNLAKNYLAQLQKKKDNYLGKNTSIKKLITFTFQAFFGYTPVMALVNAEKEILEVSLEYTGWLKQYVNNVSTDDKMIENIADIKCAAENLVKGILQFSNLDLETQSKFNSHKISILIMLN